ncbi:MAG: hypothetical protein H7296_07430 [Bacteroidia bacterium]|nr:hypothetical protein [Bacteroidia bacterium]
MLKTLGLSKFIKNELGTYDLSADHKKQLAGVFGEDFAAKFCEALAKEKDVDASADTDTTADTSVELMNSLRNHHASTVASELKTVTDQLNAANADKKALQDVVAKLSDSAETDPKAEMPTGITGKEGVKSVMKVDYRNPVYAQAKDFLQTGIMPINAATIEVGTLKTEFGTFLSQNQNNLEIVKQLFNGFTSSDFFTSQPATTEYRAIRALVTSVVQQFSAKWNPGGKAKFTPITIKNKRHKINVAIVPADVLDSYMFKLYDEGLAPDQMPITTYIINELIMPAILQDVEMRMIWKGKFVDHSGTNVDGAVATPPEDSMDGIETILVGAKTTGNKGVHFFNKFPTFNYKTATAQQMLDFVNGFVDWLSPFYKSQKMNLFCSDDFKRKYKRSYKAVWGVNGGVSGDFGDDRVDYSNQMLVSPDGMYNSPIIFSTPKVNMLKLRHKNEVPMIINDVQKVNYEVRLFGEFWMGVGFAIGEAVFAFVPTGYDPKAQIDATIGDHADYQDYKTDDSAPI